MDSNLTEHDCQRPGDTIGPNDSRRRGQQALIRAHAQVMNGLAALGVSDDDVLAIRRTLVPYIVTANAHVGLSQIGNCDDRGRDTAATGRDDFRPDGKAFAEHIALFEKRAKQYWNDRLIAALRFPLACPVGCIQLAKQTGGDK